MLPVNVNLNNIEIRTSKLMTNGSFHSVVTVLFVLNHKEHHYYSWFAQGWKSTPDEINSHSTMVCGGLHPRDKLGAIMKSYISADYTLEDV